MPGGGGALATVHSGQSQAATGQHDGSALLQPGLTCTGRTEAVLSSGARHRIWANFDRRHSSPRARSDKMLTVRKLRLVERKRLPCEPAAGWLVVDCRGRLLWATLFIVPHTVLWFTHTKGVHDGDVLRVLSACFCCLPLGVGSKASGWKRGRQGRRRRHRGRRCRGVCPCLCVGGVARRGSGRAAGRNRTATAAAGTGAVAVTQGWWRPPRAGCSRRGEVTGGRDRCALLECARQSSSDAAMVTCVRGDGKGRAAARAHRGLSLDGEWGERESSQARVPVMRDDIDSWSRPRLAERLKVVGLRAHVAGDARPQLTRRGDDDGEEHHGGEERHGPVWARSSFRSGHGMAWVFFIYQGFRGDLEEFFLDFWGVPNAWQGRRLGLRPSASGTSPAEV